MSDRKSRRTFLKGLFGAAIASGAPVAVNAVTENKSGAAGADTPVKRGYRETEHIRDYYNKVNF